MARPRTQADEPEQEADTSEAEGEQEKAQSGGGGGTTYTVERLLAESDTILDQPVTRGLAGAST